MKEWRKAITYLLIILLISSCSRTYDFRDSYQNVDDLRNEETLAVKPYLKAHMKNGNLYVLKDKWQVDSTLSLLSGSGSQFNYKRKLIDSGEVSINIDNVAIFESNKQLGDTESGRIGALSILGGLDLLVGILCLTDPKACFGSSR